MIASGQAEPADGEVPTHVLIPEQDKMQHDEVNWTPDDAVGKMETPDSSPMDPDTKIPMMPTMSTSRGHARKLPFPVILPRRRLGTKTWGFFRACSPVLEEMGIFQDAFIWFLKDFRKSALASPIFDNVIVVMAIAEFYPDIVISLAIQAVQIIAAAGQEVQERLQTNNFLTRANNEIFVPNGMFAIIVTYKKGSGEQTTVSTKQIDLGATAIVRYGDEIISNNPEAAGETDNATKIDAMKGKMKKLRVASGETHGEAQMPTTFVPLVYPALDAAPEAAAPEVHEAGSVNGIKLKSKHAQNSANYYFDRCEQADYVSPSRI